MYMKLNRGGGGGIFLKLTKAKKEGEGVTNSQIERIYFLNDS